MGDGGLSQSEGCLQIADTQSGIARSYLFTGTAATTLQELQDALANGVAERLKLKDPELALIGGFGHT